MVILSSVWCQANDDAGPGAKRGRSLSAASAIAILKRTKPVTRLIYFLYQLLQIALTPAIALYLLYRGMRAQVLRAYRRAPGPLCRTPFKRRAAEPYGSTQFPSAK